MRVAGHGEQRQGPKGGGSFSLSPTVPGRKGVWLAGHCRTRPRWNAFE